MASLQDTLDRTIIWLVNFAEALYAAAQSMGAPVLLAIVLVPLLVTLLSGRVVLFVATLLLAILALTALRTPSSLTNVLAVLTAASLFLIAAAAISQRLRLSRLHQQLADMAARLDHLEGSEARRTLADMKRRGQSDETAPTEPKGSAEPATAQQS